MPISPQQSLCLARACCTGLLHGLVARACCCAPPLGANEISCSHKRTATINVGCLRHDECRIELAVQRCGNVGDIPRCPRKPSIRELLPPFVNRTRPPACQLNEIPRCSSGDCRANSTATQTLRPASRPHGFFVASVLWSTKNDGSARTRLCRKTGICVSGLVQM